MLRLVGVTERLARASCAHPWRAVAAWVAAIAVSLGLVGVLLPGNLTSNGHLSGNPESERAEVAFFQRFPPDRNVLDELVVVRSPRYTVDEPAFRRFVAGLVRQGSETGVVANAFIYYKTGDRSLVSADRHATLIGIQRSADVDPLLAVVERNDGRDGFRVSITGEGTLDHDFNDLSQHDLKSGELRIGLPAALIILLLVFGTVVAGLVPLLMAIIAIIVALGLTAMVADAFTLSVFVVNMLTGMGLALGIDYALFVVSRYREERARGIREHDAIAVAGATASRAVLFSGSMFVVAMVGMLLVPSNVMRSLAVGAIAVGITSVTAALTLLPALLGLLGDRVNALRVPWIGRNVGSTEARESGFWAAIVSRVMRRPATSFVLFAALLLAAASPVLGLRLGASGVSTMPDRLVGKRGFEALARDFPRQSTSPVLIVVQGNVRSPEVRAGIARLRADLAQNPAFGGAGSVRIAPSGDLGAITTVIAGDKTGDRALDAVRHLRSVDIPDAFAGVPGTQVLVGGDTADNVDFINAMNYWLPLVFAFVLGLSFLLLTLVFRSIVIAATTIALNLLSFGAAYGLVVLVFQHGVASGLLGFQKIDTIEAWVPLFLFSVLFGLSMDYQVFLLSRIKERYDQTGSTATAVREGVSSTARLITGAALIIVAVFFGFAMGDLVMFQQMGFGVAVALLIDATIIRSVLLPAAMTMLGEWNWYLPQWLEWLPRIEVEHVGSGLAQGGR
jgi:putative drug exporter of the RND superfamily